MTTKISYAIAFLLGLGMIFLGVRFFLSPEVATAGFGIHFNVNGDYYFHYIKGIRDIFSGIVLCAFVLLKERCAQGVALLAGTLIPVNDLLIVLSKSYDVFCKRCHISWRLISLILHWFRKLIVTKLVKKDGMGI